MTLEQLELAKNIKTQVDYGYGQLNRIPNFRQYNNGVVGAAIQTKIGRVTVSQGDMANNRLWATQMVGTGLSSINVPPGTAAGQTANYANSTVPALATLSASN